MSLLFFVLAALFEILGCYSFWLWLREERSVWWLVPGLASLVLFALCLTRIEVDHAGRAYAAYAGIYLGASLLWLMGIEGVRPDRWDLIGSAVCLAGAMLIVFGPR